MWVIFALLSSIIGAIYHLTAQNMKIDANTFMVYKGLVMPIVLMPILLWYPVSFSGSFYAMSVLQGCISAYADYLVFGINKKYGSETVSSITPVSVVLTFFIWAMVDPSIIARYMQNIPQTFFILFAIGGIVFALVHYYEVEFTREAVVKMIPIVILSAIFAVLNKSIMNYSENSQLLGACQRAFIVCLIVGAVHLVFYKKKKLPFKNLIMPRNVLRSLIFVWLLLYMIMISLAMYYAVNPAYVSCIVYMSLIWIMLLSRYVSFFKFKDARRQGAKKWKILFVSSIILLILATTE